MRTAFDDVGECTCADCTAELDPRRTVDGMLAVAGQLGDDPLLAELVAATLLEAAEDAPSVISELDARATPEALGLLLAIRSVARDQAGKAAGVAADRLLDAGVAVPAWAAELDAPLNPVACVRVAGSLACTFERAGRQHSFLIGEAAIHLVDPADIAGAELDVPEFRWYAERALERHFTAEEPTTFADGPGYPALATLLRARMSALPAPREPAAEDIRGYRLKVTLRGAEPPVWRRVEVPAELTLAQLHQLIQAEFEWDGEHQYAFDTALGEFGPERGDVRLAQVAPEAASRLRYTYDFADDRQHEILVEKVLPRQ